MDIAAKAEEMKARMAEANPSVNPAKTQAERKRIPMTSGQRKLEVAAIPGYYCQWIRGDSARVQQATQAGFEFVSNEEVGLNNFSLGGDATQSGNTDLGTRVSIIDGSELGADGQAVRLYLMKQRQEYKDEDAAIVQSRNDAVVDSLTAGFRQGMIGVGAAGAPAENAADVSSRYVNPAQAKIPELFRRKT